MPTIFLDPLSGGAYDRFVGSHPRGSIFHSSAWAEVLRETYGFRPNSVATVENDRITGLAPFMETRGILGTRRCVSLPFSDFCEPLFENNGDFQAAVETLVHQLKSFGARYLELRGGGHLLPGVNPFETVFTHDIDLIPDENGILASLRDSTRRNIQKAEKSGMSVTHETSLSGLKEFYRLNCLTRRDHGLPPQPWVFFFHVWDKLLKKGMGFVSLVSYNGVIISGDVFFMFGKKAYYKYGASDKAYQHLRPSNLAMWEGIKQCRIEGCHNLNLGRTETHHTGLLQFKRGLGCKETTVNYYRYDISNRCYLPLHRPRQTKNIAARIVSKLPVTVLRALGSFLYKYAG